MEVALRQRLSGVDTVKISESAQTTEVTFAPGNHAFSTEVFRGALKQAHVDVVTIDVDACGVIERNGEQTRLRAGANEFVLGGAQAPEPGTACVSGRLADEGRPPRLDVSRVEAARISEVR